MSMSNDLIETAIQRISQAHYREMDALNANLDVIRVNNLKKLAEAQERQLTHLKKSHAATIEQMVAMHKYKVDSITAKHAQSIHVLRCRVKELEPIVKAMSRSESNRPQTRGFLRKK